MQIEAAHVNDLRDQLREKNILVRELQAKLAPLKSSTSLQTAIANGGEDSKATEQTLREENDRLRKALNLATAESLVSTSKRAEAKPSGNIERHGSKDHKL